MLFFFVTFLGLYVGAQIGKLQDDRAYTSQVYKPWEQLKGPYKFTGIVDATFNTVWAQTAKGTLYYWEFYCDKGDECAKWIEVSEVPADIRTEENREPPFEKGQACPVHGSLPKEPPETFVECALGSYMSIVWSARYYALLQDGTIWFWRYPTGSDTFGMQGFLGSIGLAVGFMAGIVAMISFSTKGKSLSRSAALFSAFSMGGIILALLAGVVIASLQSFGLLLFWRTLDSQYAFSEITNANTENIWAKSADGRLFYRDCKYQRECTWIEIDYEPDYSVINDNNRDQAFQKESSCSANEHIDLSRGPRGNVVECVFVWRDSSFNQGYGGYYALLDDGTISFLQYSNNTFDALASLGSYIPYGLAVGTMAFIYFTMIRKKLS